jgi:protein-S-isoprenylcysteine O-methyltransferase Ste14
MVSLGIVVEDVRSNSMQSNSDTPGVVAPPPVLFGVVFLIAFLLQRVLPLAIPLTPRALLWFTMIFLDGSGLLALWATGFMVHARTHINPLRPAKALVRGGPYRFSRNPLSVSLVMLYIGMAFQIKSIWPLLLLPPLLVVNHFGIILREERYLEAKFGDEYRNYRAAVRRWF